MWLLLQRGERKEKGRGDKWVYDILDEDKSAEWCWGIGGWVWVIRQVPFWRKWCLTPEWSSRGSLLVLRGKAVPSRGAASWIREHARCVQGPAVWLEKDAWWSHDGVKVREERKGLLTVWSVQTSTSRAEGPNSFVFSSLHQKVDPSVIFHCASLTKTDVKSPTELSDEEKEKVLSPPTPPHPANVHIYISIECRTGQKFS